MSQEDNTTNVDDEKEPEKGRRLIFDYAAFFIALVVIVPYIVLSSCDSRKRRVFQRYQCNLTVQIISCLKCPAKTMQLLTD